MGRVSQRPQARGGRVGGPVQLGGILHGQHQRDGGQAGERRVDMAIQEVLGVDRCIVEETIGRFERGTVATGLGQRRSGPLCQDRGQFDYTLGSPEVTQFGLGKFGDRPRGVVREEPCVTP